MLTGDEFKSCPCGRGDRGHCGLHGAVKQVIVIRRDLGMRRGKEVAQGAHASMAWLSRRLEFEAVAEHTCPSAMCSHLTHHSECAVSTTRVREAFATFTAAECAWLTGSFRKITCQVPGEDELLQLIENAKLHDVQAHLITDAGLTEFSGVPTVTACAVGPDWDDCVDLVTGALKLY